MNKRRRRSAEIRTVEKRTRGEILLQYNGSFRNDAGLPVGSELIHNTRKQCWGHEVDHTTHLCRETKRRLGFGSIAVHGERFNPVFWHIHVAKVPLTVFSTRVREAFFEATAPNF